MPATANRDSEQSERLLTPAQAASVLGTTERFPRRLIEERRIRFDLDRGTSGPAPPDGQALRLPPTGAHCAEFLSTSP